MWGTGVTAVIGRVWYIPACCIMSFTSRSNRTSFLLKGRHRLRTQQPHSKRNHRKGENHCPDVDQGDGSAGLGRGRGQDREEETGRNQNCRKRHTDSDPPEQGAGEDCSVRRKQCRWCAACKKINTRSRDSLRSCLSLSKGNAKTPSATPNGGMSDCRQKPGPSSCVLTMVTRL